MVIHLSEMGIPAEYLGLNKSFDFRDLPATMLMDVMLKKQQIKY